MYCRKQKNRRRRKDKSGLSKQAGIPNQMEYFTDPWHLCHMSIWGRAHRNKLTDKPSVCRGLPHYQLSEVVTLHCPLLVPGATLDLRHRPVARNKVLLGSTKLLPKTVRSETKKKKKHITNTPLCAAQKKGFGAVPCSSFNEEKPSSSDKTDDAAASRP